MFTSGYELSTAITNVFILIFIHIGINKKYNMEGSYE